MKHWAPIGLALVLVACTETDVSELQNGTGLPLNVDAVELDISTGGAARLAAQPTGTGLVFTPAGPADVCDDTFSNLRYIARSFTVTNNTGRALTNLQAHAYTQPGNATGTALKDVSAFGGVVVPDPRLALPRHAMLCNAVPPLGPDALRADLQLYSSADLSARTALVPALPAGVHLLGYGFLAQQRGAGTDADGNARTIAPGETAQLTVAFRVPVGTDTQYSFRTTFALFTDDTRNELVQTPEDQRAGTTAGLATPPPGTARVSVLGGPACGLSGTNRFQTAVLIGKTGGTDITDTELDSPAAFTIVTSAATHGSGTLHEAVSNAAPGAALCFTQDIRAIGLTIDRDLTLMGGEGAALNGQFSFRPLQITGGRVNLYGFRIYNGRSDVGAGIHNAGTLTLRGMRVEQNTAASDTSARGGGIYASGPLHLHDTTVSGNAATGDPGSTDAASGAAGPGGTALGAGIYLDNAPLRLVGGVVTRNQATGGQGGPGRHGVEEIQGTEPPGFAFCSVIPTDGGSGGDAAGAGVFKGGSSTVENPGLVLTNATMAGDGGPGGDTPGVCTQYSANLGSFGSVGLEDIAP
jgi:hypothetical protein